MQTFGICQIRQSKNARFNMLCPSISTSFSLITLHFLPGHGLYCPCCLLQPCQLLSLQIRGNNFVYIGMVIIQTFLFNLRHLFRIDSIQIKRNIGQISKYIN